MSYAAACPPASNSSSHILRTHSEKRPDHNRVGPRLLEPHHHRLRLTATADAYVAAAPAAVAAACAAALAAANGCYAPYSESYAGMALCDADGRVYPGGSIESCAYNPTMAPLQVRVQRVQRAPGQRPREKDGTRTTVELERW